MQDLGSSKAMWFKAVAFLAIAIIASALLIAEVPTVRTALLLGLVVWGSCRAYYFAFYVIEHYVDPGFRFSGLGSFIVYVWRKRSGS